MEFRFSEEEERFRAEVREWAEKELPPGFAEQYAMGEENDEYFAFEEQFRRKLAQKGWLTTWWPIEYGGKGWSLWQQYVFNEEMAAHGVGGVGGHAVYTVGPSLILHGTEEQKQRHLPAISRGEGVYWIGFTEPDAGSDLASLRLRALAEGDYFILSGQKTFIGDSRQGDYVYLAARTDPQAPKHRGISMFLVDLHSPGISMHPMKRLGGGVKNAIFFDDVRVPHTDMIGELNRGWYIIHDTLNFDRGGIRASSMRLTRDFTDFLRFCKETTHNGQPLSQDPLVQQKLAQTYIDIEMQRLMEWRLIWMRTREQPLTYHTSVAALHRKLLGVRWANTMAEIVGLYGTLKKGSKGAPLLGRIEHAQRESLFTHGGGTPEIQRNIIAHRGLGLPRSY